MRLAAIQVRNGRITQRAGLAGDVTITPHDNGFTIHGAAGPAPDGWTQSPEDTPVGWAKVDGGVRIWTEHRAPLVRFVPVLSGDDAPDMPEPDWSRVMTPAEAESASEERQGLRNYRPGRGQLQKRIEDLEAIVQQLIKATL